jgi:hypothetical protein
MEHDQRIIINFLSNEGTQAYEIIHKLQAQFHREAYAFQIVRFWIDEVCCNRQYFPDKIHSGRHPMDDFDTKSCYIR